MRIIFICNEYPPEHHGGLGTFVQTLGRALVVGGHAVTVVGEGEMPGERDDQGVRVIVLRRSLLPFGGLIGRWHVRRRILREIRQHGCDVIEVPDFAGMLPWRMKRCPVVVRLHLSRTTILQQASMPVAPINRICERMTLKKHRNWLGVSQYAIELTKRTFDLVPQKQAVGPCPVSMPARTGSPKLDFASRFVLYGGTVSQRKGAFLLAEAARQFLVRHPGVDLVYAGFITEAEGLAADQRIRQIVGPELARRVHFLGAVPREDFFAYLLRCEVFAFPSVLETFGFVVAEAMLAGRPVVTCNVPPLDELVTDGQNGLLVPPDDPSALAAAVTRLLEDRSLATTLGQRAAESIAARFSVDAAMQRTLDFYQQVIAEHRGSVS